MPTTVSGPVRLPDGSSPIHGRIVFLARNPVLAATVVLAGPVIVPIADGQIDIDLEGMATGTTYGVTAEYWPETGDQQARVALPDIVVTGTGSGTLASLAVVQATPNLAGLNGPTIKRGDTLSLGVQILDRNSRPSDLTGDTITATLMGRDGAGHDLTVTVHADPGTGRLSLSMTAEQTAVLPVGIYRFDIRRVRGGAVRRSPTGTIHIIEGITE